MVTSATHWRSIEAIPPATQRQRSPRLTALAKQWLTEREVLREQGEEQRLVTHMKNRMAIETGIIEGLYTLEQGVTETLIEQGFDATLLPSSETNRDPALVISLLKDQRSAIDCIFDLVKRERQLSTSVIKELHVLLTEHQPTTTAADQFGKLIEVPLVRGEWKQIANNPTRPDGTVHATAHPSTWRQRWTDCSISTDSTRQSASHPKCWPLGSTTGSRRFTPSKTATAAWPDCSPALSSSAPNGCRWWSSGTTGRTTSRPWSRPTPATWAR